VLLEQATLFGGETSVAERYDLVGLIADGAMGRVFEAKDRTSGDLVALKVLHPQLVADEIAVERFRREYDVNKRIDNPYVIRVLDFVDLPSGAGQAMIMELLFGEDLRATLERAKVLEPEHVLRVLSQISLALDAAHATQIVHRDLKPENVFLADSPTGERVRLLDFGSVRDRSGNLRRLTVLGTTIGSPLYMAPEQAQALDTLDHRADVWALTALAYECLVGHPPFEGKGTAEILMKIVAADPTPVSKVGTALGGTPPDLDAVVAWGLRKRAMDRPSSAGELASAWGRAYGLDGHPSDWAEMKPEELRAAIDEARPRWALQQGQGAAVRRDSGGLVAAPPPGWGLEILEDPFADAKSKAASTSAQAQASQSQKPSSPARLSSGGMSGGEPPLGSLPPGGYTIPTRSNAPLLFGVVLAGVLLGVVLFFMLR